MKLEVKVDEADVGQVAEGQDFAARVRAIATDFAFGNLATLNQGVDF